MELKEQHEASHDADAPFCRICHDIADTSHPGGELLQPCKCAGSMRHCHARCLESWRAYAPNPNVCGVCKAPFVLPPGAVVGRPGAHNRVGRTRFVAGWLLAGVVLLLSGLKELHEARLAGRKEEAERYRRRQQRRLYTALGVRQPPLSLSIQAGVTGRFALDAWRAHRRRLH